jgi:hypothetical protein
MNHKGLKSCPDKTALRKKYPRPLLLALLLIVVVSSGVARAQLNIPAIRGDNGLKSGSQPGPGIYVSGIYYFYNADEIVDVPADLFWSVTLYEAENASGLANGQPFPSLGSRDKPAQNADGSTDLYLGPKAPTGKEGNWLATVPGRGYFAIVRLYGPTEPALNKSWKPGDIEKVK